MKVNSPLANMEVYVGSVEKQGDQLVINSRGDSTMHAQVFITPQDARDFLRSLLKSPAILLYIIIMPLLGIGAREEQKATSLLDDPINKPW